MSKMPDHSAKSNTGEETLQAVDSANVQPVSNTVLTPAGIILPERFQLLNELGRGGFGIVFRAWDTVLQRDVAFKLPHSQYATSGDLCSRFLKESRAAARLNHPSIVRVLEVGQRSGIPFQVAEFVDGPRLSDWLRDESELPPRTAASIIVQLADAVQHAHDQGVLHRDIKPDNILMESSDGQETSPRPRLTDFGMARLLDDDINLSQAGTIIGTPRYMAPEQLQGQTSEHGRTTDVYALGVVLYELLTGFVPFPDARSLAARAVATQRQPPSPAVSKRTIPRDLETICLKCLEPVPALRFATAADLRDDLQRFLDGRATRVRPISVPEQLVRWARRHQSWAAGILLLLVATLALMYQTWRSKVYSESQAEQLTIAVTELNNEVQNSELLRELAEHHRRNAEAGQQRFRKLAWYSGIQKAYAAWDRQNLIGAARALNSLQNSHDDADTRPEWQLLKQQVNEQFRVLFSTDTALNEVRAVPGSSSLVVCDSAGRIHLVDGGSERLIRSFESGIPALHALAVAPDGKSVAVGGTSNSSTMSTARIFELSSGNLLKEFPPQPTTIEALDFSPDGGRLACGCRYEPIRIFDVQGQQQWTIPCTRRNEWISYHPEKNLFAAQHEANSVWILNAERPEERAAFKVPHLLTYGCWIANSSLLACITHSGKRMLILDTATGQSYGLLSNDNTSMRVIATSSDGSRIYVGHDDGGVSCWRLPKSSTSAFELTSTLVGRWDISEEKEIVSTDFPLRPADAYWRIHDEVITSLLVCDECVYSTSRDGTLARTQHVSESAHSGGILDLRRTSAQFQQASDSLLVSSTDGTIRRLPLSSFKPHPKSSGSESNLTQVLMTTDQEAEQPPLFAQEIRDGVAQVQMSSDGRWLAFADSAGLLLIDQQIPAGAALRTVRIAENGRADPIQTIRFSHQNDRVVWTGQDRLVHVAACGTESSDHLQLELPGYGQAAEFSPDDSMLICAGNFASIHLFRSDTGDLIAVYESANSCRSICCLTESLFLSGHDDGSIRIWHTETGLKRTLHPHRAPISSVVTSRDHRIGLSVDVSGHVAVWRVDDGEMLGDLLRLQVQRPGSWWIRMHPLLSFSRDGSRLSLMIDRESAGIEIRQWFLPKLQLSDGSE